MTHKVTIIMLMLMISHLTVVKIPKNTIITLTLMKTHLVVVKPVQALNRCFGIFRTTVYLLFLVCVKNT